MLPSRFLVAASTGPFSGTTPTNLSERFGMRGRRLMAVAVFCVATRALAEPTPLAPPAESNWQWSVQAVHVVSGDDHPCDFKSRRCKIAEGEALTFEIFFTNSNPTLDFCVFAIPESLPSGASFPAMNGVSRVGGMFTWTPHECQAGTYRVLFAGGFGCFDLLGAAIFSVTIVVNDAAPCESVGQCCKPDGTCENVSEEACSQADGGFIADLVCFNAAGGPLCPIGLGACCLPGGTCANMTERQCTVFNFGEFLGVGTLCEQTNPPLVCTGACCKNDFTCQDGLTKAACENQPTRGEFRGAGTVCAQIPPCSGACCFPDGGCFHLPHRLDCLRRVGDFKGRDTECAHLGGDVTCPVTGGSCCVPNPEMCIVAGHTRCGLSGGMTVDPDPCPVPGGKCPPATGACCVFADVSGVGPPFECRDGVTAAQCQSFPGFQTGDYLGDGSSCGDDDHDGVHDCIDACPNTPPGEPVFSFPLAPGPLGCSCTQRPVMCDDQDPCTQDVCAPRSPGADARGCIRRPKPGCCHTDADCDDNDACTSDFCVQSACAHSTVSCEDDGIPCTVDRCDRRLGCNFPVHELCEDHDRCTANFCTQGVGCENFTVDCGDDVPCTRDTCDRVTGCLHTPVDERCDDNNACTFDACAPGDPQAQPDGCINILPGSRGFVTCGNGDVDGNGVVDAGDVPGLIGCLERSGPFTPVNTGCPPADRDGDGDVDLNDLRYAFNEPFDCDPAACQTVQGGVCATHCPEKENCVSEALPLHEARGLSGPDEKAFAGTDETSACTCRGDQDCRVGMCERCDIPPGHERGLCRPRCEKSNCERCVNGLCESTCDPRFCRECRDGRCVSTCSAGEGCVRVFGLLEGRCFPLCRTQEDCPACEVCIPASGTDRACAPCSVLDYACRNDVCLRKCVRDSNCADCQRCDEGVCVNNCPPGKMCNGRGECADGCMTEADCPNCETCLSAVGVEDRFCASCSDALQCLLCNDAGRCRSRCDADDCQVCRAGSCRSACDAATERCAGKGNCVPR